MAFTRQCSFNVEFAWCVQAALCSVKTGLEAAIIHCDSAPLKHESHAAHVRSSKPMSTWHVSQMEKARQAKHCESATSKLSIRVVGKFCSKGPM